MRPLISSSLHAKLSTGEIFEGDTKKTTDAMRNISKKNKMYVRLRRGRTR